MIDVGRWAFSGSVDLERLQEILQEIRCAETFSTSILIFVDGAE